MNDFTHFESFHLLNSYEEISHNPTDEKINQTQDLSSTTVNVTHSHTWQITVSDWSIEIRKSTGS